MTKTSLLLGLLLGLSAAGMSFFFIQRPDVIQAGGLLLVPGAIIAFIASGNVHDFSPWVMAVGNFAFYFAIVLLIQVIRQRFASSSQ